MRQEVGGSVKSVGVWIRVSTEDQARGESPEHHEKRGRAYAEAKGWHVAETYRLEAVSGKAVMAHPEAQRMLADIRSGAITGLVFSKLARLARNTKELLDFADIFRGCGADLVSLQEAIDTSSPAGRLFFTMIAAMAQWEREEIADRVAASVPIRAKLGKPLGGLAPYGFCWKSKQLVVDPEEAPVRRLMFELFAEHQRKRTVARILNERGYRTRKGVPWSGMTVQRLLSDTTAKGLHRRNYTRASDGTKGRTLKPESDWVAIPCEAIVSDELWDRCQAILDGQRSRAKPVARRGVHLFAGLAHCQCGTRMYVRVGSPKYVCEGCRNKIPVADLEAVFLSELNRFLLSPSEIEAHARAANDAMSEKEKLIEHTIVELKKTEADETRVFDLYHLGQIAKDDFARHHRPVADRRRQLEDELQRLQAELDVMRISANSQEEAVLGARTLTASWPSLSSLEKRQMVEATTSRIVVGKDDIEIDLLHLPTTTHGLTAATSDQNATPPYRGVAFWRLPIPLHFTARKPDYLAVQGDSLAARLRRRRRELGITRIEAAAQLGTHPVSLNLWEKHGREPAISAYPAIIAFLGYEPWPTPQTLAEALKAERCRRGMNIRAAAGLVCVTEGTWAGWERGAGRLTTRTLPAIAGFLGLYVADTFPFAVRQVAGHSLG
jgi:site-specific DNA recombinase